MRDFLTDGPFKLEYITIGTGKKKLIAFHGFGRTANDYETFEKSLGKEYTIYSFNLFGHGNSVYPEDRIAKNTLSEVELKELFNKFLITQEISKFDLMGYSLGGKIALLLTQFYPDRINKLWLLAPDGIKKNFWYHFASNTSIGQKMYRKVLNNPAIFFSIVNQLNKFRLLNDKIKKFALQNMETREKRQLVYDIWMIFRKTNPNMKSVINLISDYDIEVFQFYGKYDKVIPTKTGKSFARKINQEKNLRILNAGHVLISPQTDKVITELLKNEK